jgi:AraC-like DNA-binding protein
MKDHIFNIHDVVLLMTVAECLLLAIFQSVLPVTNRIATALLTLFLVCVAIGSACTLILWNDFVHITPFFDQALLPYFLVTGLLCKGPALYLYVLALTRDSFRLKPQHLLHLLPTILCFLWMAIFQLDSLNLRFRGPDATQPINDIANQVWHFVKLVPLAYGIAATVQSRRYYLRLKDQYSEFSTTEPGWLNVLTLGFLLSWTMTMLVHAAAQNSTPQTSDVMGIIDNYVVFILINALFIYSVAYAHQLLTTKHEPAKHKQDEHLAEDAIAKVHHGMEIDKYYLKQNLNIEEFSKRIDLPVKEVSAVINKHYGTNFFEFMNTYRITEAKRLLSDPQHADMTVLDVLLQSGFNSKSAFHRFFNRLVGVSPTEFRKRGMVGAKE